MASLSKADTKIHILYLVKHAPGVSYQMLLDKCMESLYVDFFVFSEVYNELIAGNLMDKTEGENGTGEVIGSNETLVLTEGGEAILEDVQDTLNDRKLGYLSKAAAELKAAVDDMNAVKAFAEPSGRSDGSFIVRLKTTKDGRDFHASIKVSGKEQADTICRNWRNASGEACDRFIDELLKM